MSIPVICKIRIYPVKSLDPIELEDSEIGHHALKNDRAFAIMGENGRYVNGKRTGDVNRLHAKYDLLNGLVKLTNRGEDRWETFELREKNEKLEKYLRDFFKMKVYLLHRKKGELMDIPKVSSVTIISENSLLSLQQSFPEYSIEDIRLRFRTNIEVSGVEAYWEEKLFVSPGIGKLFTMGDVEMIGVSPRARCNVPPRNPWTGETDKSFISKMIKKRQDSLPDDSTLIEYGGPYHLTVNTFIPETEKGKQIKLGDKLIIKEDVQLN